MKSLILCAGCVALLGCAQPVHGMTYHIIMDSDSLSLEQQDAIVKDGMDWEDAVPGLTLSYESSPCDDTGAWEHTICVFINAGNPTQSDIGQAYATTYWDDNHVLLTSPNTARSDSATVNIWMQSIAKYTIDLSDDNKLQLFANAMRHELGHAFTHNKAHLSAGNLMQPTVSNHVDNKITESDVAYFWETR